MALATRSTGKGVQILEAAVRVLRERGLGGFKVEDVAKAAEVGKGTVYLYFKDKRDLLRAAVEHRAQGFYREAEEVTTGEGSFESRLRELLARRVAFVEEWRGLWGAVVAEVAGGREKRAWLQELHGRYQRILEAFVADGVRRGELRADLDARLAAAALAALGCSPMLDEIDRGAFLDQLVEVWMRGVGAKT